METRQKPSTAIVLLGKSGDLMNFLPIARHLHTQGDTPAWIVNINYVPLLRGVTYVKIDPVQFPAARIHHALEYAKVRYSQVINGQPYGTFGKVYDTQLLRDKFSFNRLAWEFNGFGDKFNDRSGFRLIFDNRDAEREKWLVSKHRLSAKPLILLAVGCSRSSPFATHHAFSEAIRRKHGNRCEIVDLCDVKAARLYDILGLFEAASLLICGDNSFLHLAAAVQKLPVMALVNDKPFLATEPRCNAIFRVNYSKVTISMEEIHCVVSNFTRLSDPSTRS